MNTRYCGVGATVTLALLLVGSPFAADAGDGKFDGDDLVLHVYFEQRENREILIGTDPANFAGSWKDYVRQAAVPYYDVNEGLSRIKKVYIYNSLAEGKAKADIWVGGAGPSADTPGFGTAGRYLYLPRDFHTKALSSNHYMTTLAHELGHYIYSLKDSYGGQIETSATHTKLPVELLSKPEQGSPFGTGATVPGTLNYRTYMWSDEWLKFRVPGLAGPTSAGGLLFYELSGKPSAAGGVFDRGSIMSAAVNATVRDREYSVATSHVEPAAYRFKMPAYNHAGGTRAADKSPTGYDLYNNQHDVHKKGEWPVVLAYQKARNRTWTLPAELTMQTLAAADLPEVILIEGAAIALCIDHSGSMADENRMTIAQGGARAAIAQLRLRSADGIVPGHSAGVVSFDNTTTVNSPVAELLTETNRSALVSAVDALAPAGGTSIGGGLRTSLNQLLLHPDKAKAIILLSDGEQNSGEPPASVIPDLVTNEVTVYTVAVGAGADTATLAGIASATGGEMRAGSSGAALTRFFIDIFSKLSGAGSTTSSDIELESGQTYEEQLFVEQGCERLVVLLSSTSSTLGFSLVRPDGSTITPATVDSSVRSRTTGTERILEVDHPASGTWKVQVDAAAANSGGPFVKTETPPLGIADNTQVSSPLAIGSFGTIEGLTVRMNLAHTYIGDLQLTLTSPAGTQVILHSHSGGSSDDIVGTYGEGLVPAQPLAAFDGQSITGTWTLTIADTAGGDTGALNDWALSWGTAGVEALVNVTLNSAFISVNGVAAAATFPQPMKIRANVSAVGGAVGGAQVEAIVSAPNGASFAVPLFDDGRAEHGDDAALDGSYSALFTQFTGNGVYDVTVNVTNVNGFLVHQSDQLLPGDVPASVAVPGFDRTFSLQSTVANVPADLVDFLTLKSLKVALNAREIGADSMSAVGTFSRPKPAGFDPRSQVYDLQLGGGASIALAGPWKKVGRLEKYVQRTENLSGVFSYFLGGSSKSTFKIAAKNTDFTSVANSQNSLPVTLASAGWSDTVNVTLNQLGQSLRFGSTTPAADFFIDTLSVRRNPKKAEADALTFVGRLLGPATYSPQTDTLQLNLGTFAVEIPPATLLGNRKLKTTIPRGSGRIVVTYDPERHTLLCAATKQDFSGFSDAIPVLVTVAVTGTHNTTLGHVIDLRSTGNGKVLSY